VGAIAAFNGRGTLVGAFIVAASAGLVVTHLRKRRWRVVVFNSAQLGLGAAAAAACYLWLHDQGQPLTVIAIAAAIVYALVNVVLVVPGGALESGQPPSRIWADLRPTIPNYLVLGLVGALLGRLYVDVSPVAVVAILVPVVIARSAFQAVVRFRQAYAQIETLYGFTAELERSTDEATTVACILGQAKKLLKAEVAELTLCADGALGRRSTLDLDAIQPVSVRLDGTAADVDIAAAGPLIATRAGEPTGPLGKLLAPRNLRDAMIAPLRVEGEVVGSLMVASRFRDAGPFTAEDLRLFETLTNHAAVSIENSRLLDRLRWDSHHDGLTGLTNRTCFNKLIKEAVDALPCPTAIMLIDLDRFKEVNDTLGHHHGDLLLREVATRLRLQVGERGTVARLGGDEFAVLLPDTTAGDAAQVAVSLLGALERPFTVGELNLEVTASIGVALMPSQGREPITLLQRAEVAMYAAKTTHSGWEIYSRERDQYSPRRLALAGELHAAINSGQLEVHYQPKAEMSDGTITGMEALVRWRHPRLGLLGPDEFIAIAEHAGLIRQLTFLVLHHAVSEQHRLAQLGFDIAVAVNLSVRSVLDVDFPDQVATVLRDVGVKATSLIVEITESSVMADPPRTIGVLGRLSALGVSVAIDDFGTGYSSLSRLKRLPVDEIKIDKSFVGGMLGDENDAVIVRSTIDLAHNLGLRVVAEGVEDYETWVQLAELGCDMAQGYYVSRPVPAGQLAKVVQSQPTAGNRAGQITQP
jgi:diguanylate cyclase (GGDEF)-like protein